MNPFARLVPVVAALVLLGCDGAEPIAPADVRGATYAGSPYAAPTNVAAVALSTDRIRVTWQDNTTTETRFEVFRNWSSAASSTSQLQVVGANVTMLEVGGLSASSEHCFQVRAVRDKGGAISLSPFSTPACAKTFAPPEPVPTPARITSVVPAVSTAMTVRWVSDLVPGLQSRLDRSLDDGATWAAVSTSGGRQENWYFDGAVPNERMVCYRVVDYNATATAAPSNTACSAVPAGPTELTATTVDVSSIDLAWHDASAFEDGYQVRAMFMSCWDDPDYGGEYCETQELVVAELPANATSYRTTRSDAYAWTVFARKTGGFGGWATVPAPGVTP